MFYQPQVHLADGGLIGAEALIRSAAPGPRPGFARVISSRSLTRRRFPSGSPPGSSRPPAGRPGHGREAGHPLRVGVNLSPSQLHSGDLAKCGCGRPGELTGLTPALLELEVTEDILLLDEARVLDTFLRIRRLGVRIVFDDFGTGYASLSYLKKFPLDGLKIDKSFVLNLVANSDDAAIVGSTVSLSKQLGLSVIAEGIENRATADLLARMGCEEGQGYFFGRPMPAVEFGRTLEQAGSAATPAARRGIGRRRLGRKHHAYDLGRKHHAYDLGGVRSVQQFRGSDVCRLGDHDFRDGRAARRRFVLSPPETLSSSASATSLPDSREGRRKVYVLRHGKASVSFQQVSSDDLGFLDMLPCRARLKQFAAA